jgi:hypothetical protein
VKITSEDKSNDREKNTFALKRLKTFHQTKGQEAIDEENLRASSQIIRVKDCTKKRVPNEL